MLEFTACAQGSTVDATFTPGAGGDGFGGNGGAGGTSTTATTTSGSTTSGDSTGIGGAGAGGAGAGGDASSSTSSTGTGLPACDYAAPNTCPSSENMSGIDGDQNSDTRVVKGTTAKWFKVLVTEAVSSVISYPALSYTATLVSPPGMDFDLFEYTGTVSMPSCSGNPTQAMGNPESVTDTWGDTVGTDDTRWLTLEVRYISGEMCPSDPWTLTVQGHTN